MPDDEPKIFIDEDWKSQVQREKEQALAPAAAPDDAAAEEAQEDNPFLSLVSSLAAQVMHALGLLAGPDEKQVYVDIEQARYIIEILLTLREKTKGNLSPEEEGGLNETIAELQRVHVAMAQHLQETALRQGGVLPNRPAIQ